MAEMTTHHLLNTSIQHLLSSQADLLASLPEDERVAMLRSLTPTQLEELEYDWRFWARPKQLPPEGDWATWVIRAGRGFGKTRSGGGWVHERALEESGRWCALVGRTPADVRDYMLEGPGGILRNTAPRERPHYEPSKRRVTWPNGSWATIYSGDEPDQLRGFSGDTAWLDEMAKYRYAPESWDNMQFGMREASGDRPRRLITTTPRPLAILKQIEAMASTIVVTGSSYENRANLDPTYFAETIAAYEGTRFGRQEIHAEILEDVPGALWTRRNLDEYRVAEAPAMSRIVIAVDPAATSEESSNETGIVAAGLAPNADGVPHGYTLDDWSLRGSPDEWGRRVVACYRRFEADRIVAEKNQGGEMVEHVIKSVDPNVPVTLVHASRGKYVRAEPVSALYEQGRVHHVGSLPVLEDQMIAFTPESSANRKGGESPDRVDALVWAYSDLFPQLVEKKIDMVKLNPLRGGRRGRSWMGA